LIDQAESRSSQISVDGKVVGNGINSASAALTDARFNTIEFSDKNLLVLVSASVLNEVEGSYLYSMSAQKEAGAKFISFSGVVTKDKPVIALLPMKNSILPLKSADFIEVNCKLKN
jgi:hypothetical protein